MRGNAASRIAVLLGAALAWAGSSAAAAPAPIEIGARAYALGGAYTAVADDISALRWNPAGLSATRFEIGVALAGPGLDTWKRLQELRDRVRDPAAWSNQQIDVDLRAVAGISLGPLGAGAVAGGSLELTTSGQGTNQRVEGRGQYSADLAVGLAAPVFALPMGSARLTLGLAGRKLQQEQVTLLREYGYGTLQDPQYRETVDRWKGEGYAADVGVLLGLSPYVQLGARVENALSRFSWSGTHTVAFKRADNDQPVGQPQETALDPAGAPPGPVRRWRAGVAIRPPILSLLLAADVEQDGTLHYGVEKGFLFNAIRLRVGQSRPRTGPALTTAGVGFALGPIHVDAAAGSTDGFRTYHLGVEAGLKF